ncbi:YgaP family membrane protein [Thalassococcus sp. BH17M4-6]|uniref:YgaP family membrane protein n=1 Tax=Thalassococcus sp. BH17M4-6 TaxID=3413148 RepID=UPI003BD06FBB
MTTNVGTIDRVLRAALGIVLLYLAFFSGLPTFTEPLFKYGAAIVGIVMLATSTLKLCPLYSIFGIKTCKDC